ncbi:MAG TPA: hypothetical protein VHX61_14395 [Rhizomicrobium sp.]|jgi:hypothetical protein|nr:hypothetical protein [Rhizomicrobium sp.]
MINRAAMRAIRRPAEPRQEPANLLALVDECASLAWPDGEATRPWAEAYAKDHRLRMARDLELVKHYLPAGAKLAEFGAVPLLLTLPL